MTKDSRTPNLFIVGAPKCGTTAMSSYLAGHPDIFMSEQAGLKEPNFFCNDLWFSHQRHITTTWSEYLNLFALAPACVKYIGEATPLYLGSRVAIKNILENCPSPRFVVMLRNPVELVVSLHNQYVKAGLENVNFERAWNLQEKRLKGSSLPPGVDQGEYLNYANRAKIGEQLKRLYETVDREAVHCIFFDDFKRNPGRLIGIC